MKKLLFATVLSICFSLSAFADNAQVIEAYGKVPLSFTVNKGQTNSNVRFTTSGNGCSMFFTPTGTAFVLSKETEASVAKRSVEKTVGAPEDMVPGKDLQKKEYESFAIKVAFVGANETPDIVGEDRLSWNNNYFIGNDASKWQTDVPNYSKVRLIGVYNGIDLVYYGNKNRIKYDFVVKPGEDPYKIILQYDLGANGGNALSINSLGELVVSTPLGEVLEKKPYCYQMINGKETEVTIAYRIIDASANTFGFQIEEYDGNSNLVIDPELAYSTFLGGFYRDSGCAISVDNSGNAYVTGITYSTDYPTTTGAYDTSYNGGDYDVFVTKLNASGNSLVYSTFLGGSGTDYGRGKVVVDSSGNAYVTGQTESLDYPTTTGAYDTSQKGGTRAFVTKLNSNGNSLSYSTFLGVDSFGYGIAVDSSGNAYVTGQTGSSDFPTTTGAYDTTIGNVSYSDVFVTKLDASGSSLVYSTFIGSTYTDVGKGITIDNSGNAYVTGYTQSSGYPITTGAFNTLFDAGRYGIVDAAFVTKLNASGSSLVYSTFLVDGSSAQGNGIAVDSSGNAYVTGHTQGGYHTTTGAYDTSQNGGGDAFVTKLNASGSSLVYSTFLGGSIGDESGNGIAVDNSGNAYVTGVTHSTDYPTTTGAYDRSYNGGDYDVFVTKLNASGNSLVYSTFLGGSALDEGNGIAVDSSGNAYVTGTTYSTDYPTTTGAYDTSQNGVGDSFVTKLNSSGSSLTTGTISGTIKDSTTNTGISGATVTITPGNYTVTTGTGGTYSIANITAGTGYTVTVLATNYTTRSQSGVIITVGATTTINLTLLSLFGTISGTIKDSATNTGISGATVTITQGNFTVTTGSGGTYSIANVPVGTGYTVTVTSTGYNNGSQSGVRVISGTTSTVNLSLTPALGTISGTIKNSTTNTGISGATVTVTPGNYTATTGSGGTFSISNVPVGSGYTVTVTSTGYNNGSQLGVSVMSGTTSMVNLSLTSTSQAEWSKTITITQSTNSKTLTFGVDEAATTGIEDSYGETELPPTPVSGIYDVRFTGSTVGNGLMTSIIPSVDAEWTINIQRVGTAQVTLTWDNVSAIEGSFKLQDTFGGSIFNVNMKSQTSYTITNSSIIQVKIIYSENPLAVWNINLPSRWNMVGLGLDLETTMYTSIFTGAISAYGFNNGYTSATNLEIGKGYWLNLGSAINTTMEAPAIEEVTINLSAGWHMISGISQNITLSQVTQSPANSIVSLFGFEPTTGYSQATTIEQGKGYWIKVNNACSLTIHGGTTAKPAAALAQSTQPISKNILPLTFEANNMQKTITVALVSGTDNEIGSRSMACELPPLPPVGIFDIRFSIEGKNGTEVLYMNDSAASEHDIQLSYPENSVCHVTWNNHLLTPGTFMLKDGVNGCVFTDIDMASISELTIPSPAIKSMSILYTRNNEGSDNNVHASAYELSPNFPNPFNPTTTISYSIASSGNVRLSIYNLAGQEIATLVNGEQSIGHYTIEWDGRDQYGRNVAGGVYIYKLKINDFVKTQKMTFLK